MKWQSYQVAAKLIEWKIWFNRDVLLQTSFLSHVPPWRVIYIVDFNIFCAKTPILCHQKTDQSRHFHELRKVCTFFTIFPGIFSWFWYKTCSIIACCTFYNNLTSDPWWLRRKYRRFMGCDLTWFSAAYITCRYYIQSAFFCAYFTYIVAKWTRP